MMDEFVSQSYCLLFSKNQHFGVYIVCIAHVHFNLSLKLLNIELKIRKVLKFSMHHKLLMKMQYNLQGLSSLKWSIYMNIFSVLQINEIVNSNSATIRETSAQIHAE